MSPLKTINKTDQNWKQRLADLCFDFAMGFVWVVLFFPLLLVTRAWQNLKVQRAIIIAFCTSVIVLCTFLIPYWWLIFIIDVMVVGWGGFELSLLGNDEKLKEALAFST